VLEAADFALTLESLWFQLGCQVRLPEPIEQFLAPRGPLPTEYVDRRRHRRFDYRQRAILTRQGQHAAVYTKNISRGGVSFLHAEQLYPREEVALALPFGCRVRLTIRRCRRQQAYCFECGAEICEASQEWDRGLQGLLCSSANELADPALGRTETPQDEALAPLGGSAIPGCSSGNDCQGPEGQARQPGQTVRKQP
jgi:hypothetical protein